MTLGDIVILILLVVGYIVTSLIKKSPEHILNRSLESYKNELNTNMEKLKRDLTLEISDIEARNEQKRIVYTNLVTSMSVFIGGRVSHELYPQYTQNFYNNYDAAWLWASDEVMKAMSRYMQFKIEHSTIQQEALEPNSKVPKGKQQELMLQEKELFLECIFKMRKDVFSDTTLSKEDYKFIKF